MSVFTSVVMAPSVVIFIMVAMYALYILYKRENDESFEFVMMNQISDQRTRALVFKLDALN